MIRLTLEINRMGAAGGLAGVSIEVVPVSPDAYHRFSMLAPAPPGVTSAPVYGQAQRGEV